MKVQWDVGCAGVLAIAMVIGILWCASDMTKQDAEREAERAREARELAAQADTLAALYANRCSDRRVKLEKILGSWYVTAGPGSAGAPVSTMMGPNWRVVTRPLNQQGYREVLLADVDPACETPEAIREIGEWV